MSPNQPNDGGRVNVSTRVNPNKASALRQEAHERSTPQSREYVSDLLREAVDEWLENHFEELTPEARDFLDDDTIANAGGVE